MRGKDASKQEGCGQAVVQQAISRYKTESKGDGCRDDAKNDAFRAILFQVLEVHLQACKEHDEVDAYFAEEFERGVSLEQVESVLSYQYACQYHSDEMWNV